MPLTRYEEEFYGRLLSFIPILLKVIGRSHYSTINKNHKAEPKGKITLRLEPTTQLPLVERQLFDKVITGYRLPLTCVDPV